MSREIVATRTGKIYTYRGPEEAAFRDQRNEVWVYDLDADEMKPTGQRLAGGFWNGKLETLDRNTFYLSTVSGELYELDVQSGVFAHLGYFIDPVDHDSANQFCVRYLYGINFSRYERKRFSKHNDLERSVFTGSGHTDRVGNVYTTAFDWNENCTLAVLRPTIIY